MKVDCISDLHGFYPNLEGGDLLIIAGDMTACDDTAGWLRFYKWINNQKYKKVVFIAGNHDHALEGLIPGSSKPKSEMDFDYLCDSGTEFEGVKIWGSPWSLWFAGINKRCTAFTGSEEDLKSKWDLIPKDTNILITHSPPYGILDETDDGRHVGSWYLRCLVTSSYFQNLNLHAFGHIHECGGRLLDTQTTKFVNASYVNEDYKPVNQVMQFELYDKSNHMECGHCEQLIARRTVNQKYCHLCSPIVNKKKRQENKIQRACH